MQSCIHNAFKKIKWDSQSLQSYVKQFSAQVYTLQDKVTELLVKHDEVVIPELVAQLRLYQIFQDMEIQRIVDEMNLAEFANLRNGSASWMSASSVFLWNA